MTSTHDSVDLSFLWLHTFLALSICVANALLILSLIRAGKRHQVPAVMHSESSRQVAPSLLLNKAISDLLVAVWIIPWNWLFYLMKPSIPSSTCVFGFSFLVAPIYSSIFTLLAIGIDRYLATMKLDVYERSWIRRGPVLMTVGNWIIVIVAAAIPVMGANKYRDDIPCMFVHVYHIEHVITTLILSVAVLTSTTLLYVIMFRAAWLQRQKVDSPLDLSDERNDEPVIHKTQLVSVKLMFLVLGLFYLCWTPYVATTAAVLLYGSQHTWLQIANKLAQSLAYTNSLFTPLVCLRNDRECRRVLSRLVAGSSEEAGLEEDGELSARTSELWSVLHNSILRRHNFNSKARL